MNTADDGELDRFSDWERESWEHRAASYAASLGDLTTGSVRALLDAAAVAPGTQVLDVGTGPGFVALEAAARGARVQAIDQSAEMVRIARQAGVDAQQSGVAPLPFVDHTFDAVVAGYVLNHLARPAQAVGELGRVLKPGGRLAMTIWDESAHNPAIGLIGAVCAELGLTADVPAGPDPYRFADEAQVARLLVGWGDLRVQRPRWSVLVEPGAWFDAIADSTPRSGAVLAQASPTDRAEAREVYVQAARDQYGTHGGKAALPAGAVLISATPPLTD